MTRTTAASRKGAEQRESMRSATLALCVAVTALVGIAPTWAHAAQTASCHVPSSVISGGSPIPSSVEVAAPTPAVGAAIIQVEGEADATPAAAQPAATPVAPTPDPLVVLTEELTAVAESLAACLTTGDAETVTALAGERYLGQLFGGSVPLPAAEYVAIAEQLAPVPTRIVALEEVSQAGDDRATAAVTQVVGHQLMRAEWTFAEADGGAREPGEIAWQVAGERQLPVSASPDAEPIGVELQDRSFSLSAEAAAGPDIVLRGINVSADDHEMLVLRLASGYTTADLLRATGPDLPQEVTFIGQQPVSAGEQADLVLVDLEPGAYTLVCLFTDEEGTPHLAQGMEAAFTVG